MTCRRRFGYNVLEKGADAMDARILVVDDEPEIADLVEVYLKSEGCTVFKCGTGTERWPWCGTRLWTWPSWT